MRILFTRQLLLLSSCSADLPHRYHRNAGRARGRFNYTAVSCNWALAQIKLSPRTELHLISGILKFINAFSPSCGNTNCPQHKASHAAAVYSPPPRLLGAVRTNEHEAAWTPLDRCWAASCFLQTAQRDVSRGHAGFPEPWRPSVFLTCCPGECCSGLLSFKMCRLSKTLILCHLFDRCSYWPVVLFAVTLNRVILPWIYTTSKVSQFLYTPHIYHTIISSR